MPRLPRTGEPDGFGVAVARGLERAVVALVLGELFKKLNELRSAVLANQGSPTTVTGVERLVVVPSPSWPEPLAPQHLTAPPESSAQVCK